MKVLIDGVIYTCSLMQISETTDVTKEDFEDLVDVDKLKNEVKTVRRAFKNKLAVVTKNRLEAEIDFWQKVPVGGEYTDE